MSTPLEKHQRNAYLLEFGPAVLSYTVLVFLAAHFVGDHPKTPLDWALVSSPILPAIAGAWAVARSLKRADEYQQRIQYESIALAFAAAMLAAIATGFTKVPGSPWVVYLVGMTTWLVAVTVKRFRG